MPVTATPAWSGMPPAPQRLTDTREEFIEKADPWADALDPAGEEIEAIGQTAEANAQWAEEKANEASSAALVAAAALSVTDYVRASSSSVTLGTGTKTWAVTACDFVELDLVRAVRRSDPEQSMTGQVQPGSTSTSIILDIDAEGLSGTPGGPYTDWILHLAAFSGAGADAADLLAGTSSQRAVTAKAFKDAKAFATLTDGATVTIDATLGRNFNWTIGGNRTLAAITNCAPGDVFLVKVTQDGTGSRILAWASGVYKRQGGLPVLSTAAAAVDYLQLKVITVDGSNVATLVLATFVKGPTT